MGAKFARQTILILKPVVAALEEKAVGVLVAQVDTESDEDDADDGSQDAHHNDGGLKEQEKRQFLLHWSDHPLPI